MTLPDRFVTGEPGGDLCIFEKCDSKSGIYRRLELKRNRVCFMHDDELSSLDWVVPIGITSWVLGEPDQAQRANEVDATEDAARIRSAVKMLS